MVLAFSSLTVTVQDMLMATHAAAVVIVAANSYMLTGFVSACDTRE
jgi:hypothetical protein